MSLHGGFILDRGTTPKQKPFRGREHLLSICQLKVRLNVLVAGLSEAGPSATWKLHSRVVLVSTNALGLRIPALQLASTLDQR